MPFSLDQPYWIDDDQFDLEFHVRHIALPRPGDWRQLCILLTRLHAWGLDLKAMEAVLELYKHASSAGHGKEDCNAVFKVVGS